MQITNLAGHLGLGDAIVLSGAAVYLSQFTDRLRVFCWHKYAESVKSFYSHYPSIEVMPIDSEHEMLDTPAHKVLKTGLYAPESQPASNESWDRLFYRQLGLPIDIRWTHCPIAKAWGKVPQISWSPGISLVHDDESRRYTIRELPERYQRIRDNGSSVLGICSGLINAPQIHVIDSSVFHLVESLSPKGELFLHRYARPFKPGWHEVATRHQWKILE